MQCNFACETGVYLLTMCTSFLLLRTQSDKRRWVTRAHKTTHTLTTPAPRVASLLLASFEQRSRPGLYTRCFFPPPLAATSGRTAPLRVRLGLIFFAGDKCMGAGLGLIFFAGDECMGAGLAGDGFAGNGFFGDPAFSPGSGQRQRVIMRLGYTGRRIQSIHQPRVAQLQPTAGALRVIARRTRATSVAAYLPSCSLQQELTAAVLRRSSRSCWVCWPLRRVQVQWTGRRGYDGREPVLTTVPPAAARHRPPRPHRRHRPAKLKSTAREGTREALAS